MDENEKIVSSKSQSLGKSALTIEWSDGKIKVVTPTSHIFNTNDVINISGLTTDLSSLNGSYKIGITTSASNANLQIDASGTSTRQSERSRRHGDLAPRLGA